MALTAALNNTNTGLMLYGDPRRNITFTFDTEKLEWRTVR